MSTQDKIVYRPWLPIDYEKLDIVALHALRDGCATAEQQKRALDFLIREACKTYDMDWFPGGGEAERDSSFAAGRRFVGQQLVKLLNLNLIKLSRSNDHEQRQDDLRREQEHAARNSGTVADSGGNTNSGA